MRAASAGGCPFPADLMASTAVHIRASLSWCKRRLSELARPSRSASVAKSELISSFAEFAKFDLARISRLSGDTCKSRRFYCACLHETFRGGLTVIWVADSAVRLNRLLRWDQRKHRRSATA
jgi:hypothetical protein